MASASAHAAREPSTASAATAASAAPARRRPASSTDCASEPGRNLDPGPLSADPPPAVDAAEAEAEMAAADTTAPIITVLMPPGELAMAAGPITLAPEREAPPALPLAARRRRAVTTAAGFTATLLFFLRSCALSGGASIGERTPEMAAPSERKAASPCSWRATSSARGNISEPPAPPREVESITVAAAVAESSNTLPSSMPTCEDALAVPPSPSLPRAAVPPSSSSPQPPASVSPSGTPESSSSDCSSRPCRPTECVCTGFTQAAFTSTPAAFGASRLVAPGGECVAGICAAAAEEIQTSSPEPVPDMMRADSDAVGFAVLAPW